MKVVSVQDYLARGYAIEQAVTDILLDPQNRRDTVIEIPKGEYEIRRADLPERLLYISNHDSGVKSIFLDLSGCENVTLDANGSVFTLIGRIVPVVIENASGVTVKNMTIDFKRTFFTQGEVLYADERTVRLKIDRETYPYRVENNRAVFYGEDFECSYIHQFTEFDPVTRAPAYGSRDNFFKGGQPAAREAGPDVLEFGGSFRYVHKAGNIVVLKNDYRYIPGIFAGDSTDVRIENVLVHQCGSMALIAQMCENVTLERFRVLPRENSGRMLSSNTDASHFVNCSGKVLFKDCHFEGMLDDGINVHGAYAVIRHLYQGKADLTIGHPQQYGVVNYKAGDLVRFVDPGTLQEKGRMRILEVKRVSEHSVRIGFELAGGNPAPGDLIENDRRCPDLEVAGCRIGNNRARCALLQIASRAYLHDNVLYSAGTAVIVPNGDHHFWYEAGATGEVILENNLFRNAHYALWGTSVLDVLGRAEKPEGASRFHERVVVRGNRFEVFETPFCTVDDTERFEFADNEVSLTDAFAPLGVKPDPKRYFPADAHGWIYRTVNCGDVIVGAGDGRD